MRLFKNALVKEVNSKYNDSRCRQFIRNSMTCSAHILFIICIIYTHSTHYNYRFRMKKINK